MILHTPARPKGRCIKSIIVSTALLAVTTQAQTTSVLFNMESGVGDWTAFGAGAPVVEASLPGDAHTGSGALKFSHNQDQAVFGGVANASNVPVTNWLAFDKITYWVKSSLVNNSNEVAIEIRETASQELWKQRVRTTITSSYQKVELDLLGFVDSGFDVSAGGDDFSLDVSDIDKVNFVFFPMAPTNPSSVAYFIDDVELLSTAPLPTTLSVSPSTLNFGSLSPAPGAFRFSSTTLTCTYSTAATAWHIEVYTTNALDEAGLVSPDSHFIPLKVHQPVYGGGSTNPYAPPNPNIETNWTTASAVFRFVSDPAATGGTNTFFVDSSISPNTDTTPFSFAVDAGGAYKTNYTGAVFFEFIIE